MESSWKEVFMITMIIASFILSALTFLLLYTIIQKEKLFFLGDILNKSDDGNEYHLLEIGSGLMTGTFFLIALNLIFTTYKHTTADNYNKSYKEESTTRILHWSLLVLIVFLTTGIGLFAYDYFSTNENLFGETNKTILLTIFSISSLFLLFLIILFISLDKNVTKISEKKIENVEEPETRKQDIKQPCKEYEDIYYKLDYDSVDDEILKSNAKKLNKIFKDSQLYKIIENVENYSFAEKNKIKDNFDNKLKELMKNIDPVGNNIKGERQYYASYIECENQKFLSKIGQRNLKDRINK